MPFGYWSDHNYDVGDIARWVDNAQETIAHIKVHEQLQELAAPHLEPELWSSRSRSTTARTR